MFLFDKICAAGGDSVKISYDAELKNNPNIAVISVAAGKKLAAKMIYFTEWRPSSNTVLLRQSIQKLISDTIEKAVNEKFRSIAFPAIGCGRFGQPPNLIAEFMVDEVFRQLAMHSISVSFVIEPTKTHVYDEFQKRIERFKNTKLDAVAIIFEQGEIEVRKGNITEEKVYQMLS